MATIDKDPIICPDCGGTGMHPWKTDQCNRCNGTGEITDDIYDDRYMASRYRATSGCFEFV